MQGISVLHQMLPPALSCLLQVANPIVLEVKDIVVHQQRLGVSGSTANDGQCNFCSSGQNQKLSNSNQPCATCAAGSASANAETECVTCEYGTYQDQSQRKVQLHGMWCECQSL